MNIRPACPADAPVIVNFNLRLAEESEGLKLDPAVVGPGAAAVLSDPHKGTYYVAELAGEIAGQLMITYEWSDWRNGNLWWIQSVYVKPEFRQRGVFRALFAHLVQAAQARTDVAGLRLYMHAHNAAARRTYERLGMRRTEYEIFELELARAGQGVVG